jgi:hypothetical protein
MADRTRTLRQGRQIQRGVRGGRVQKSRSRDSLTIVAPPPASLTTESTVSRRRGAVLGPTSSRPQTAEPALSDNGQQSADDSIDSRDGEYEDNDGQSEASEEEEHGENDENDEDDEDVVELGADDEDLSEHWGAQRPIGNEFLSSQSSIAQPSILTITPGHTQTSSRRISYPERGTPAPIQASQNRYTPGILSRLPAAVNTFATPVLTQRQRDPRMRELDNGSGQRTSRRNMAVGLERSILLKARDLMWDWTIFTNPFPDPITLTEEVRRCWRDARTELGFPNFGDATLPSIDQVRYP